MYFRDASGIDTCPLRQLLVSVLEFDADAHGDRRRDFDVGGVDGATETLVAIIDGVATVAGEDSASPGFAGARSGAGGLKKVVADDSATSIGDGIGT